ncbi:MAG: SCO family protein [Anaerolineae bacterium]|nr:SCO family protein [Anaerolineae bacterium]
MTTLNQTPKTRSQLPVVTLALMALLLSFGGVLLLLSVFYVRDIQTLRDLPDVLWSFICGIPVENGATLPLLIMLALVSFVGAGLAWGWQRLNRTRALLAIGALVAVLLLFGLVVYRGLQVSLDTPDATVDLTSEGRIHSLSVPRLLSDFTLVDNEDKPLSLSDLQGRYTLLFFGYLHCPDFCPTTLAHLKQVHMLLGDDADRVNVLFISVDGDRDTPEALDDYLSRFEPSFIGMRGERTVLAQITPDYGLSYTLEAPDAEGNYAVSHSVQIYLIDPERQLHAIIDYGTPAEEIVDALRALF